MAANPLEFMFMTIALARVPLFMFTTPTADYGTVAECCAVFKTTPTGWMQNDAMLCVV